MTSSPQTTRAASSVALEQVTGVQLMQGIGVRESVGFWTDAWQTVMRRKAAVFALVWVGIVAFFAVFSPILANGHPLMLRPLTITEGGKPIVGDAVFPLWQNLTAVDLVILAWGLVAIPFVWFMPGKGRGRRFWTMIGALVLAISVLAISGIVHARLDSIAQDQARQARDDIARGVAAAGSVVKPFVNRPLAGAIVGGVVAAVVLGLLLAIPFSKFRRRLVVGVCAVTLAAAATHLRWERPLVQIDYVARETAGQIRATYTLIPWSPMQRDSGLDRKPPGASRLISQIEHITSHLPIRDKATGKQTMSAEQIASIEPRLAELSAVFAGEVEGMRAVLKKAAQTPDTLTRDQLRTKLDAVGRHEFVMGTDAFGQDVLSQVLHSCRLAISIGLVSTGVALLIGVTLGAIMGYFGGWIDLLLYRVVEIFMAVPVLFLLIVAVAVLPEELRNTYVIMAIIGCFTWTGMARFTRAEFMKLRNQDFVQSARSAGLPLHSILFKHMLPNGVAPVLVDSSFAIAAAISIEAVLSYLGLGPVDSASWGKLLSSAISTEGEFKWWLAVFPGTAIFLTVLSYNLIGEALRDAIDPKLKKARV